MPLESLAQGTEAAGEAAAVDGHDESHSRALLGAGLVVGAGNVILDRFIDHPFFRRHLQKAILDPAIGDRCGQQARLEILPQQFASVP